MRASLVPPEDDKSLSGALFFCFFWGVKFIEKTFFGMKIEFLRLCIWMGLKILEEKKKEGEMINWCWGREENQITNNFYIIMQSEWVNESCAMWKESSIRQREEEEGRKKPRRSRVWITFKQQSCYHSIAPLIKSLEVRRLSSTPLAPDPTARGELRENTEEVKSKLWLMIMW